MKINRNYIHNFTHFLRLLFIKIVKKENYLVSRDVRKRRLNTCKKCSYLINKKQCGQCGCFVYFKSKISFEDCPMKFWN